METVTYLPPLRAAVLFSISLRRGVVSVTTLANLAQVAPDRAQAFASILVARGAILKVDGGYVAGPAWDEWSGRPSAARPHQGALSSGCVTERTAADTMDAMRRTLAANIRAALDARQWSARELARRAGLHMQYVHGIVRYATPPPAMHLLLIARALETTVEQLATSTAQMQRLPIG